MGYVRPGDVTSPKSNLTLIAVLDEGSAGQSALAIGEWRENKRGRPRSHTVLLMRWNGFDEPVDDENEVGVPSSRGYPTWFVVPEKYYEVILQSDILTKDRVAFARRFFPEQQA